jgi:hypothetical protein
MDTKPGVAPGLHDLIQRTRTGRIELRIHVDPERLQEDGIELFAERGEILAADVVEGGWSGHLHGGNGRARTGRSRGIVLHAAGVQIVRHTKEHHRKQEDQDAAAHFWHAAPLYSECPV